MKYNGFLYCSIQQGIILIIKITIEVVVRIIISSDKMK